MPHLLNQLQDVRCRRLPHRHGVYYAVTTVYGLYAAVSQLFMIFLALGQLDLLLVRLFSDLAANIVTTGLYLETKTYDPLALMMDPVPGVGHDDHDHDDDDPDHDHDDDDPADKLLDADVVARGGGGEAGEKKEARAAGKDSRMAAAMEMTDASFGCEETVSIIDDAPLLAGHGGGRPP